MNHDTPLLDYFNTIVAQSKIENRRIKLKDFNDFEDRNSFLPIEIDVLKMIQRMDDLHHKDYYQWLKTLSSATNVYNLGHDFTIDTGLDVYPTTWPTNSPSLEYLDLMYAYQCSSQATSMTIDDEIEMEERSKSLEKELVSKMNTKPWIERLVIFHLMECQRAHDIRNRNASALDHSIGVAYCLKDSPSAVPIGALLLLENALEAKTFSLPSFVDQYPCLVEAAHVKPTELPDLPPLAPAF